MKKLIPLMVSILAAGSLAGCCGPGDYLSVTGFASVELEEAETGFEFQEWTRLADDALAAHDGPISGQCAIMPDGVVEVTLLRPGTVDQDSRALQSLSLELAEIDEAVTGQVAIALGPLDLSVDAAVDCANVTLRVDDDLVDLSLSCAFAAEGATAQLEADLLFDGCEIVE